MLRLRLAQELATGQSPGGVGDAGPVGDWQGPSVLPDPTGPEEPRQEYRRLLMLEGLQHAAGQCLRRLEELRAGERGPMGWGAKGDCAPWMGLLPH